MRKRNPRVLVVEGIRQSRRYLGIAMAKIELGSGRHVQQASDYIENDAEKLKDLERCLSTAEFEIRKARDIVLDRIRWLERG